MSKSIDLKIKITPELEQGKLKTLISNIEQSFDSIEIGFDDSALEAVIDSVDELQSSFDSLNANGITEQIEQLADTQLDGILDGLQKGLDELDTDKLNELIRGLSADFDATKQSAVNAFEQQKKAVAQLANSGKEGTDEYQNAVELLKQRKQSLDDILTAERKVNQLLSEPAPDTFDTLKKSAISAFEEQRQAVAKLAAEGKQNTDEYESQVAILKRTKQAVDDIITAEQEVNEILNENEDTNTSILEIVAKYTAIGDFGDALSSAAESGVALRDALANAQAKTGATAEEMELLKQAAEDAFVAGVGESVADAVGAMATAQQQLGDMFNSQELTQFTVQAAAIGQVFDKDVNEVIAKSRTFIKNFGLDGEQAGNLISLAMQGSGSAMDDTLDTLDEYSQLLKQTGFTAEESIGLFNSYVQQGGRDTDKLADSIKETQIRLKAGDIANALGDLSTPITKTIQDIVKSGEQGKISVREVLSQSAQAIETAFDAGQISDTMRSQLQVAISGTPAEDMGSELYGRIFSQPIDVDAVSANASQAAQTIASSLGAVTTYEKINNQIELVATKASSFFAPAIAGAGGLISSVSQIAPALTLAKDAFPMDSVKQFGSTIINSSKSIITTLIPSLATAGATGTASFFGIQISATAAWAAATLGIVAVIALLALFFTKTEAGKQIIDSIGQGFEDFISIVGAVLSNATDIVSAFAEYAIANFNPANWFSDEGEQKSNEAFKKLTGALVKTVQDANGAIAENDLGRAIEKSAQIKGELDKNAGLQKLIDRFKTAKTEAEKNSIAEAIQAQVPGAVQGIKQITDANGRVSTSYDINIKSAQEFADAQKNAYSNDLKGQQDDYLNGLQEQVRKYDENKSKLKELGDAMIEASKQPGNQEQLKSLQEEYKKTVEETNKQRDAIAGTVKAGEGLGIISKGGEEIKKKFGEGSVAANAITKAMVEAKSATKQAAISAADLAKGFDEASQQAQTARDTSTKAAQQVLLQMKAGQITAEEGKKLLAENRKNAQEAQNQLDTIQQSAEQTENAITTLDERREATVARNEKSLQSELSRIDYARTQLDIAREYQALSNQTGADAQRQYNDSKTRIDALSKSIADTQSKLKTVKVKADREELNKSLRSMKTEQSQLQALLPSLKLSVDLQLERDSQQLFTDSRNEFERAVLDINTLDEKINAFRTRINSRKVSGDQLVSFKQSLADLEKQKKDIEATLPTLQLQTRIDADAIADSLIDVKVEAAKELIELTPEFSTQAVDESIQLLTQRVSRLQGSLTGLNLIDPKKESEIKSQIKQTFDSIEELRNLQYKKSLDNLNKHYEERRAILETSLTREAETANRILERQTVAELKRNDRNLSDNLRQIEEAKSAELSVFSQALDSRALRQQQIEDKYAQLAITAQKRADQERLVAEERKRGAQLQIANESSLALLKLEQDKLKKERALAEQRGDIKAYDAITKKLDGIEKEIKSKGSVIGALTLELQTSVTDIMTNLVNADTEEVKNSFRKSFAVLAGVLERQASAAISKIIIDFLFQDQSPWYIKMLAIPATQALVGGLVGRIMQPAISALTSFSTGGSVDKPTMAILGDARMQGGSQNKEWVFRDEQLRYIVSSTANASQHGIAKQLQQLQIQLSDIRVVGVLSGRDIMLVMQRSQAAEKETTINVFDYRR